MTITQTISLASIVDAMDTSRVVEASEPTNHDALLTGSQKPEMSMSGRGASACRAPIKF